MQGLGVNVLIGREGRTDSGSFCLAKSYNNNLPVIKMNEDKEFSEFQGSSI